MPNSLRGFTAYGRIILVILLYAVYGIVFRIEYPLIGRNASFFVVLPVFAAAWLFGLRIGLIASLAGEIFQTVFLNLQSPVGLDVMLRPEYGLFPTLALLAATVLVGRMSDLGRRLERELDERKKTEASLRESQRLAQQIMQASPDLIYIYDIRRGQNIYSNQEVSQLLGFTPAEIEAMPGVIFSLVHPDDAPVIQQLRARYTGATDGEVMKCDFRVRHKEDVWRWISIREVVFARGQDGKPSQMLGIAQDITDLRRTNELRVEKEKLQVAFDKEREVADIKHRFMNTISHEFRTPLATIVSSAELLTRYYERLSPARRDECFTIITSQVQHLREMLDEIAMVASGGRETEQFRPIPTPVNAFCTGLAHEVQLTAGTNYEVRFSDAPQVAEAMLDTRLLGHVLKNLLLNAVKYSPKGGVIDFRVAQEGGQLVFTVRDTGIGIPSDDIDHIFDTFHRGKNVGAINGTGLGLAIVRQYTELQGGTVSVQSEVGKGSTFTVRLPLQPVRLTEQAV
jgi:PAS domain S-box-containing protein